MKFDIGSMISTPTVKTAAVNKAEELPIDMLIPYNGHPFDLYTGERFDDMVNSISRNGVLTPIIVRTMPDGRYEILAGHNRTNAAKAAGKNTIPAIIKDGLSDEEAQMYVIETNAMQRGFKDLRISEQAAVVALRHSKMFSKKKLEAVREELKAMDVRAETSKSDSKLAQAGEEYGLSRNTAARLIRIHKLLQLNSKYTVSVDTGKLSVRAATELSYIRSAAALESIFEKYNTDIVVNNVWEKAVKLDVQLAERLRDIFEDFDGTQAEANSGLAALDKITDKPVKPKAYKISSEVCGKYFTDNDTQEHIEEVIGKALDMYFKNTK